MTALTHRSDAVYPATIVGPPPMEDAWLGKATERIFLPLLRMLFPEIVDMNLPVEGAFHNLVLVSIKKQYPFHAARIAHGLWGAGQMMFSKVIVRGRRRRRRAEHGRSRVARCSPTSTRSAISSFVEGPIDQLDHGANQALYGGKVCIDATRKWAEEGYPREWPEVCRMTPETTRAPMRCSASSASCGGRSRARQRRHGDAAASGRRDVLEKIACARRSRRSAARGDESR